MIMEKLLNIMVQRACYLLIALALWCLHRRRQQWLDAKGGPACSPQAARGMSAARPKHLYRLARQSEPARCISSGRTMREMVIEAQLSGCSSGGDRFNWSMDLLRGYRGVVGLDSKCIHLSTAEQVPGTAAHYFGDEEGLLLLTFSTAKLERDGGLVRFEEAQPPAGARPRPGGFPHVYPAEGQAPSLSYGALVASRFLQRGADGKHIFPDGALNSGGAGGGGDDDGNDGDNDDDDDDDDEDEDAGMYGDDDDNDYESDEDVD